MPYTSIIALFDSITLMTKHYHWIHSSRWNNPQLSFFIEHRRQLAGQIFHPPNNPSSHNPTSYLAGRWILFSTVLESPIGWAEIQIFNKGISKGFLILDIIKIDYLTNEAIDAIVYMISAIFHVSAVDVIYIGPVENSILADFFVINFPDSKKTLKSFLTLEESWIQSYDPAESQLAQSSNFVSLAATSWRKSPVTAQRVKQLTHLNLKSK